MKNSFVFIIVGIVVYYLMNKKKEAVSSDNSPVSLGNGVQLNRNIVLSGITNTNALLKTTVWTETADREYANYLKNGSKVSGLTYDLATAKGFKIPFDAVNWTIN